MAIDRVARRRETLGLRYEALVAALPEEHVRFGRFAGCGHGVFRDDPVNSMRILREFITQGPSSP